MQPSASSECPFISVRTKLRAITMKTELKLGLAFWPLIVPAVLILVQGWQGWLGLLGDFVVYWLLVAVAIYTCVYFALAGPRPTTFKVEDWLDPTNQYHPFGYGDHFPWSTGGDKPRWKPGTHLTRERAVELGFDLMEVANWDDEISQIDDVSMAFCEQHAGVIGPVVATDVHQPDKDRLCGWTLLYVDELTEDAVMAELRAKRTDVLVIPGGLPYYSYSRCSQGSCSP